MEAVTDTERLLQPGSRRGAACLSPHVSHASLGRRLGTNRLKQNEIFNRREGEDRQEPWEFCLRLHHRPALPSPCPQPTLFLPPPRGAGNACLAEAATAEAAHACSAFSQDTKAFRPGEGGDY